MIASRTLARPTRPVDEHAGVVGAAMPDRRAIRSSVAGSTARPARSRMPRFRTSAQPRPVAPCARGPPRSGTSGWPSSNACMRRLVGDDVAGDPVASSSNTGSRRRTSPISSETARISVTSSPATLSTPAPPSRLERPQDHADDIVDVDRVHAGTPTAVELDRLACLDPLDEAREHPPLLAWAIGNEEPEDA